MLAPVPNRSFPRSAALASTALLALALLAPHTALAQDTPRADAVSERVTAFLDATIAVDIDTYVACLPPERRDKLTVNQRAAMERLLRLNQSGDAAMVSYELGDISPDPDGPSSPDSVDVEVTVTGKNNAQTRYVARCLLVDDEWFVDSLDQVVDGD